MMRDGTVIPTKRHQAVVQADAPIFWVNLSVPILSRSET